MSLSLGHLDIKAFKVPASIHIDHVPSERLPIQNRHSYDQAIYIGLPFRKDLERHILDRVTMARSFTDAYQLNR